MAETCSAPSEKKWQVVLRLSQTEVEWKSLELWMVEKKGIDTEEKTELSKSISRNTGIAVIFFTETKAASPCCLQILSILLQVNSVAIK